MMNLKKQSVLVVCESFTRRVLEEHLMAWNYSVMTAYNERQAISHIQSNIPDLVVADLTMPEMDGFELLRYIRQTVPELPIVVMSEPDDKEKIVQALHQGAWDYIYKPIQETSFLQFTVEKVLEKSILIHENGTQCNPLEVLAEHKNAELMASEEFYRTVAKYISNWEYWLDKNGNIAYISPSCQRITGYSFLEFIQDSELLYKIVHPEDHDIFSRHVDDYLFQDTACNLDFRIIRRDGQQRWIAHNCRPVADCRGNSLGIYCSNRDITNRKKMEIDLSRQRQALDEKTLHLEEANKAFKTLLDHREIEKKMIEQNMVANLKRFVLPYLNDLERQTIGENALAYVNIIRTNIQQLISPVSKSLSGIYLELTPTEAKVVDLIRQGNATKSIADILNISTSTVEKHRNKIRQKLNITKKKVNLYTYLNSLQ